MVEGFHWGHLDWAGDRRLGGSTRGYGFDIRERWSMGCATYRRYDHHARRLSADGRFPPATGTAGHFLAHSRANAADDATGRSIPAWNRTESHPGGLQRGREDRHRTEG